MLLSEMMMFCSFFFLSFNIAYGTGVVGSSVFF